MSGWEAVATDVNLIAEWLANQEISSFSDLSDLDRPSQHSKTCLVICGSAIFHCFERIYEELRANPSCISTLVLCGGVGHSTAHLYEAIKRSTKYAHLYDEIAGRQKSEAEFMYAVLEESGTLSRLEPAGVKVLVESKSTNCGANAILARNVMAAGSSDDGTNLIIVQDPTMSLRTVKCFEKTYESGPKEDMPDLICYPTFVPKVKSNGGELAFHIPGVPSYELWDMDRFLGLLLGEVPRLRPSGYGPEGAGFIPYVDVPVEVENAWARLNAVVEGRR